MNLRIAIVIVGYKNASDIARCILALEKSTYRDFEIVICENGGGGAFAALQAAVTGSLAGGQNVRLIQAPGNGGYASGINIALAQSSGADAWWILNPDTEPSPVALAALVAQLKRGFDAVGGPIHFPSGEIETFGGVWLGWRAKAVSLGYGQPAGTEPDCAFIESEQNYLSGASMFVNRRFLEITGPMAERYFLYCEEVDWFLRGGRRGMRLGFAPDAVVVHHKGTTTGYSRSLRARSGLSVYLDERNKMLLTREYYPARLPVAAILALIRHIGRYGRRGAFRQVAWGAAGWFKGLCGQAGPPS